MATLQAIIMVVSIALMAAFSAGLYAWNHRERLKEAASKIAELAEIGNIKDTLKAAAFAIVTALERQEGKGTGALKLASAVHELMQIIPEQYRGQFTAQALADIVEDALAAAKLKWAGNPALLQQGQSTNAVGFTASAEKN